MKLSEFIKENNIRLISWKVDANPNMEDSKNMDNWGIEILHEDRSYITFFSKGKGHKGAVPTIDEVLECMNQDIWSVNDCTPCDFIEEFGYDCRTGYKVYKTIKLQIVELQRLFGDKYEEFENINTDEDE